MITRESAGATETEEHEKTQNALIDLRGALRQTYRETVPEMRIYGSQARKEATASSDIDILLIYPYSIQPAKEISRLSGILADLNLKYQVLVSVLPISKIDYLNAESPLLKNIRLEGIAIESV